MQFLSSICHFISLRGQTSVVFYSKIFKIVPMKLACMRANIRKKKEKETALLAALKWITLDKLLYDQRLRLTDMIQLRARNLVPKASVRFRTPDALDKVKNRNRKILVPVLLCACLQVHLRFLNMRRGSNRCDEYRLTFRFCPRGLDSWC